MALARWSGFNNFSRTVAVAEGIPFYVISANIDGAPTNIHSNCLKAGSQYIVRVASRPEVIVFSMGLDAARRRNRIEFYFCVALRPSPLKKK